MSTGDPPGLKPGARTSDHPGMTFGRRALAIALASVCLLAGGGAAASASEYQPDGLVRRANQGTFLGDGVYNNTGANQTVNRKIGARGSGSYYVQIQNDGAAVDSFVVRGSRHNVRFGVRYFLGAREVTGGVKAGTLRLADIAPRERVLLRVQIATRGTVPRGAAFTARVVVRSAGQGTIDVTRARLERPLYSAKQLQVRDQINASRRAAGRNGLAMNRRLADKAQSWAQYLANIGRLQHSNLTRGVPSNWRALGENVGYDSSLGGVHGAFMRSSGHRANILGNFTHVGTGVAHRGRLVFVVHVFMRT